MAKAKIVVCSANECQGSLFGSERELFTLNHAGRSQPGRPGVPVTPCLHVQLRVEFSGPGNPENVHSVLHQRYILLCSHVFKRFLQAKGRDQGDRS
ncbi:hypothetical protein SRHO_G00029010 [Serrasalmus rhombeus]